MSLRDQIAKNAYDAADKFVRHKTPLNDTILAVALKDNLNSEIVKRICEEANKNVYLALWKSETVDKSKIVFPRAQDDVIMQNIQTETADAADYILPPGVQLPTENSNNDVIPDTTHMGITGTRDVLADQLNKIENALRLMPKSTSRERQKF